MARTDLKEQEATERDPSIDLCLDMIRGDPCENCENLENQIENLEDLLKKVQHQRNKLYVVLCNLYDVQNGPPLIKESKKYEDAMEKARKIIKYIKEGK